MFGRCRGKGNSTCHKRKNHNRRPRHSLNTTLIRCGHFKTEVLKGRTRRSPRDGHLLHYGKDRQPETEVEEEDKRTQLSNNVRVGRKGYFLNEVRLPHCRVLLRHTSLPPFSDEKGPFYILL